MSKIKHRFASERMSRLLFEVRREATRAFEELSLVHYHGDFGPTLAILGELGVTVATASVAIRDHVNQVNEQDKRKQEVADAGTEGTTK